MNFDITEHVPQDFSDDSRVWIYQSSRLFTLNEAFELEDMLADFIRNWKSHGTPVKGFANLYFGRFIIFMADERATAVGGCSTDSSVHLVKSVETKFNVQLFDRQSLAFFINDKVELLPLSQLPYAISNNFISADTLYFNNTVLTKRDLIEKWIIPVKESWLAKRLQPAGEM